MRLLLRCTVTLLVLLTLFGGGFYLVQSSRAKRQGEEYTVGQLPGDLVRFLRGLAESGEEATSAVAEPEEDPASSTEPEARPEVEPAEVVETPPAATGSDWGRERYDRGDFRGAMHAWEISLKLSWDPEIKSALEQSRLFSAVRDRFPAEAEPPGETTVVEVRSGATFEGRILSRDDEGIRLEIAEGKIVDLPANKVVGTRVVSAEQRRLDLEEQYRTRLAAAESDGPRAVLELAEWSHVRGFPERLPYLLEKVRELEAEQGAVLGPYLAEAYPGLSPREQDRVAQVMDRFYPTAPGAREILLARMGVQPAGSQPFVGTDPGDLGTAPSRISADFVERTDRAKALAKKGAAYYEKARPGLPGAAENRKKALELLTEAKELFEELIDERPQARWLEKYLQQVYVMHRWLRKDTPVR